MDEKFTFIDTETLLKKSCEEISKEKIIGIDIECENNLHHYGIKVAIIQISTKTKNYIVDTLVLKNIDPLVKIFENPTIKKIFHDVSFDLRMLFTSYKCNIKNVYDTQLAKAFLGKPQISLSELLEEYFNVKKNTKFQMADWSKRPLPRDLLNYAINDTKYLIEIQKILDEELKNNKRIDWVYEELKNLESKDWNYHQGTFLDIRGINQISDKERGIAYELFKVREKFAKRVNRPTHFIFTNKRMIELSQRPYLTLKKWQNINGVHPIVKQKANEFLAATLKGKNEEIKIEKTPRKRYNKKQIELFTQINEAKDIVSEKLKLPKHLIVNKEQAKEIALSGNLDILSNWQKELIKKEVKNI